MPRRDPEQGYLGSNVPDGRQVGSPTVPVLADRCPLTSGPPAPALLCPSARSLGPRLTACGSWLAPRIASAGHARPDSPGSAAFAPRSAVPLRWPGPSHRRSRHRAGHLGTGPGGRGPVPPQTATAPSAAPQEPALAHRGGQRAGCAAGRWLPPGHHTRHGDLSRLPSSALAPGDAAESHWSRNGPSDWVGVSQRSKRCPDYSGEFYDFMDVPLYVPLYTSELVAGRALNVAKCRCQDKTQRTGQRATRGFCPESR